MKSQADSRVQIKRGPEGPALGAVTAGETAYPLAGPESMVWEVLRQAGCGLTVRQIEAIVPAGFVVPQILDRLLELRLVSRLNTIFPAYACRRSDAGVYAE